MNMYYPSPCVQMPGATSKVWPGTNAVAGVVCHSEEGYAAYGLEEVRDPNIPLSWHFTVLQDGRVEQHYPITAVCWHAGNHPQNARLIGIEHEGVTGEPLTAPQLAASVTLVRWIAAQGGWAPERHQTLFEHHEVAQLASPNAGPTSCPSGRIPWGYYTQEEEAEVKHAPSQSEAIWFDLALNHVMEAQQGKDGRKLEVVEGAPPGQRIYQITLNEGDGAG